MKNLILFFFLVPTVLKAQSVLITPGNSERNVLATSITNGLEIPRLTLKSIFALQNPIKGTLVFDLDHNCIRIFNGSRWIRMKAIGTSL
jgi:hypothetical protein